MHPRLHPADLEEVQEKLGRDPTVIEESVLSSMWSEHCSYRHTKSLIKSLPYKGKYSVSGRGENAGVLSLPDGGVVAFKIESHNHPSYIEPFQGAATGVGGIIRDIMVMGVRPVALGDGLFFGTHQESDTARVARGVVKGISSYGNNIGLPVVTGQTIFHPAFVKNPLVNILAVGYAGSSDVVLSAKNAGEGDLLLYFGSLTGRDGIGGAVFASKKLVGKKASLPNVQVADPYFGAKLMEATFELGRAGLLTSIQDMGACGILSSTSELCHKSRHSFYVDLARIPLREELASWQILLSETQERMMATIKEKNLGRITKILQKHFLEPHIVGSVGAKGNAIYNVVNGKQKELSLPTSFLIDGFPAPIKTKRNTVIKRALPTAYSSAGALLKNPGLSSRESIFNQYDTRVGSLFENYSELEDNILELCEENSFTKKRILVTFDAAVPEYLPYQEGVRAELLRALVRGFSYGGIPLGISNGINAGNPDNDAVRTEIKESFEALGIFANALGIPVVSGNASLYNQDAGGIDIPTVHFFSIIFSLPSKKRIPMQQGPIGKNLSLIELPIPRTATDWRETAGRLKNLSTKIFLYPSRGGPRAENYLKRDLLRLCIRADAGLIATIPDLRLHTLPVIGINTGAIPLGIRDIGVLQGRAVKLGDWKSEELDILRKRFYNPRKMVL